jgi:hypothetical protein
MNAGWFCPLPELYILVWIEYRYIDDGNSILGNAGSYPLDGVC